MPEENPEREGRILDAAARLIERYGYDKTTVDEIARDAGVSKGAIYLHFKSKDDLFESLVARESDVITVRFYELLDADPRGISLYTIYRYGLAVLDESPLLKAVYTRDRRVLGDYARKLRDAPGYNQAFGVSVDFVRQFQEAGLLRRDLDPEAVTYLLSALRYGILTMEDFSPNAQVPSVDQLGETLAEMLSTGLAAREVEGDQEAGRKQMQEFTDALLRFVQERQQANRS